MFLEMYGTTESGNIACNRLMSEHVLWKLLPCDGAPDGCGELAVKTGSYATFSNDWWTDIHLRYMFDGYFKDEQRTAAAFTEDGFYKTGDLCRVTESDAGHVVQVI